MSLSGTRLSHYETHLHTPGFIELKKPGKKRFPPGLFSAPKHSSLPIALFLVSRTIGVFGLKQIRIGLKHFIRFIGLLHHRQRIIFNGAHDIE